VVSRSVNNAFNDAFTDVGLHSELGYRPAILSFLAFAVALSEAFMLMVRAASYHRELHGPVRRRGTLKAMALGSAVVASEQERDGKTSLLQENGDRPTLVTRTTGLWSRVGAQASPTWKRHNYVPIEKQSGAAPSGHPAMAGPSRSAMDSGSSSEDEDASGRDQSIPLRAMGTGQDTAYDPYRTGRM
jgi:hypothetical protein